MTPGYDKPLYLLPFDHRKSYLRDILHLSAPLSVRQREAVMETKEVIYAGFCTALTRGVPDEFAGILVDEEFGAVILRHASAKGYTTALPLEKSGSREFEFECGPDFASQIEAFRPTFAKALVRFNPEGDSARNRRQVARLKQLSDYCRSVGQRFMFELLVPATPEQLARATHADTYDEAMRPSLVLAAIRELQDAGVEPDVWKIEGLDRREDCAEVVRVARRNGRGKVGCIVLGRAADETKVVRWLETAASVPGFIGFAVGRTTFQDALTAYVCGYATRDETASSIARRYRRWVNIFEQARWQDSNSAAKPDRPELINAG